MPNCRKKVETYVRLILPYNRKDISPACISRTARAETNSRAERDSRAEPRVVDMENWNDQNFWRSEKKQTESTNLKILGGPLHVMYCIVVVTMLAWGMTAMTRSISGATAMLLTDATDRTIYHFRCKFFYRFRLSWLLFRYVIVVFENRWNSVPSTSTHGYVV